MVKPADGRVPRGKSLALEIDKFSFSIQYSARKSRRTRTPAPGCFHSCSEILKGCVSRLTVSLRAKVPQRVMDLNLVVSSYMENNNAASTSFRTVSFSAMLKPGSVRLKLRSCFRRWKWKAIRTGCTSTRRASSADAASSIPRAAALEGIESCKSPLDAVVSVLRTWGLKEWASKGQLTGLLGNLSLLSYFASKRERGAMVVQAVGVVSTLVVLSQLAVAGAMPNPAFTVTASVVAIGLVLNFLNYNDKLNPEIWRLWGEAVSVGGVTVLPQVMWATFEPYIPHSMLPGAFFGTLSLTMIILARLGKLPKKVKNIVGAVSAWTATLLFMWAPVAQWWTNYLYPANIKGLSVFTVLLAMVGNSLLLPRALFTRDLMWFTGSGWGTLLQGWGILISMYTVQVIGSITFWGVTGVLFLWLSLMLWKDSKAFDLNSPFSPLLELISGKGH